MLIAIGGFNAFISSDAIIGSGLSSSASVEVLISPIMKSFFSENKIYSITILKGGSPREIIIPVIERDRFDKFLSLIKESGDSSSTGSRIVTLLTI